MSGRAGRWRVPYTAPGSKGGFLMVRAISREDAINKAIAKHGGSRRLPRFDGTNGQTLRLTAAQRAHIEYGEPECVGGAA